MTWDCGACRAAGLDIVRRCGVDPAPGSFKHVTKYAQSFDRCPKAWLRDDAPRSREDLDDWRMLRHHGVMLEAGGLLDQPARYVDAVQVIDGELSACRAIAQSLTARPGGG